ncbi:hypothetical protein GWI33_020693 [Rhynchophorus ferrugineus]|uniref:Carboxylesterase type B domain-containing protein n=1 Tax=Rhynchophorus ferrugineus TaxID=354439 RepID=A0A834HRP3_RHYFE|nr:hypothetical protein GWI33_020693 [Rhynchophorus ferrugineus]
MSFSSLVVVFVLLSKWVHSEPTVKISQGTLRGTYGYDMDGNKFHKFLGIPYAKPPVKAFRFRNPEFPEPWDGILNATTDRKPCPQKGSGSEDCLYLNLFTRTLPSASTKPKPVIVYIYGGGFMSGSSNHLERGPEFLLSQDIVLVSFTYRLGLLGLIRFKNARLNVTGNMSFKDQVMALRWVQRNIEAFNGDPKQVTLFGDSSGSASVHYHVLSPLARGLFSKAIMLSGSALTGWGDVQDINPVAIAQLLNSSINNELEAYRFFMESPASVIVSLQDSLALLRTTEDNLGNLGLVLERQSPSAFMYKRPIDIIRSGNYTQGPLLIGYESREGILFNYFLKVENRTIQAKDFLQPKVDFRNEKIRQYYVKRIQDLYFSGPNLEDNIISVMSDSYFVVGLIGTAQNHALTSNHPVYLYKSTLDTSVNYIKNLFKITNPGCSHGDDLGYIFNTNVSPEIRPGSVEDISRRRLVKMLANFAKYGNPTPSIDDVGIVWPPITSNKLNTLNIDVNYSLLVNPEYNRMLLWRDMFNESNNTYNYLFT